MAPLYTLLFAILLMGCNGNNTEEPPDVTYYQDIRPLVETHCTRCHFDGGPGTGDLTDLNNVQALASVMLDQMEAGRMPPPVSDPDCRSYENSDRFRLAPGSQELLERWIELGTPLGEPETAVTVATIPLSLENPDLELVLESPYTPTFEDASNPGNEYRCFILDPEHDEDFFITALAPIIDQPALVHHLVLATVEREGIDEQFLDPQGFSCINGEGPSAIQGMITGWAPGMMPVVFSEGQGMRVAKDEVLMLQMHYFAGNADAVGQGDQSGYQFKTASSIDREVLMFPLGHTNFLIPAGAEDYASSDSFSIPNGFSAKILGTFPHMHILGSGYKMWIESSDESSETCVVESDAWDFDNQITYMFDEEIVLSGGDTVHFECRWNNSTSNPDRIHETPIPTGYGERTDEEMCFAFTLISLQ